MSAERLVAPSAAMEKLWAWAERTETGDRAELTFTPRGDDWEALDADADDCVGEFCPRFADCHFFKRRDAARFADIVVVNHALFFLDLAAGGTIACPPTTLRFSMKRISARSTRPAALTATLSAGGVGRMMRKLHRTYTRSRVVRRRDRRSACGACRWCSRACRANGIRLSANDGVLEIAAVDSRIVLPARKLGARATG